MNRISDKRQPRLESNPHWKQIHLPVRNVYQTLTQVVQGPNRPYQGVQYPPDPTIFLGYFFGQKFRTPGFI